MKKILTLILVLILVILCLAACTNADHVNHNLSKKADTFEVMRRITVYNARTDTVILEMEGLMSISNDSHDELVVTCMTGPNEYKKNYVYLNEHVLYVVEDITGSYTDPYRYVVNFHTSFPIDMNVVP